VSVKNTRIISTFIQSLLIVKLVSYNLSLEHCFSFLENLMIPTASKMYPYGSDAYRH